MSNPMPSPEFEEKVRRAVSAPNAGAAFVDELRAKLVARAAEKESAPRRFFRRPAWQWALTALLVLLIAFLAIGPQRVVAAMQRLFGYIPGVGVVDQSSPIRVLAEPVSQTREEITLTVNDAILTSDKTIVLFTLENVPWQALSHQENVVGCVRSPELRLPDGTVLQIIEGSGGMTQSRFVYAPIPTDVNSAVFVLPCIMNTLPDLAPENWELPLRFVPASPDMTVMPVVEIAPSPSPSTPIGTSALDASPLSIAKVLEIGDNDILFVEFDGDKAKVGANPDGWWQSTGPITITDGNGNEVFKSPPPSDIELPSPSSPNAEVFAYQISKYFVPPLTISYPGIYIAKVGAPQQFQFEFDAGDNPQPGQVWTLNKEFTMDGYGLRLVSVSAESNGYTFSFEPAKPVDLFTENSHVLSLESVDIAGYTPLGGGGGGGGISLIYSQLPVGKLNILVTVQHLQSLNKKDWQVQWIAGGLSAPLYGIALKVDKYIPLADGYYVIGHIEWDDERIKSVYEAEMIRAFDATGREAAFERASFSETLGLVDSLDESQWVYRLYGKAFSGPLTLRLGKVNVMFDPPAQYTLDLRSYGFAFDDDHLNTAYKTGIIPLDVPGLQANAFKAAYVKEGDLRGFEISIEADPRLQGLTFQFSSGLDITGLESVSSSSGSYRDETTGLLMSRLLTDAALTFPLTLTASDATVSGDWTATWNPPAVDSSATPFYVPQPCVSLKTWKQVVANSPALPTGLSGQVLAARGAVSPEPSLFLVNLAGSGETPLVFGDGSLSPDGLRLVYSDENNRLYLLEIASGRKTFLTDNGSSPRWSPDGKQIAFLRQTDKGMNVFVMDASGSSQRALTDTTDNPILSGWMPDSRRLILTIFRDRDTQIQTLDVASGVMQILLTTQQTWDSSVAISPDGTWLAYADKVPGRMMPGIYLSRLDGSEKRLLVQLDDWMAIAPVFSPDGKRLAFTILNTDRPDTPATPALLNVNTCEVIPLPGVEGEVRSWVP